MTRPNDPRPAEVDAADLLLEELAETSIPPAHAARHRLPEDFVGDPLERMVLIYLCELRAACRSVRRNNGSDTIPASVAARAILESVRTLLPRFAATITNGRRVLAEWKKAYAARLRGDVATAGFLWAIMRRERGTALAVAWYGTEAEARGHIAWYAQDEPAETFWVQAWPALAAVHDREHPWFGVD